MWCERAELAAVKAGALARVAGGAGRFDERQHGVTVAVQAQGPHPLGVAAGGPLVPLLGPGAAVEVQLAAVERPGEGLLVHVGEHQHLPRAPVLDDARHQPVAVEGDWLDL